MATQTQAEVPPSIHLRPALNSGPNITTLAAFSPDIIPLDQVKASAAQLVSSYNDFIAHSIDLDEPTTLVYIRGKQSEASANLALANLRAVPNELVLWPQVWETASVIGHTGFGLNSTYIAVGGAPIQYSPIPISGEGHSHATLVATVGGPNEAFSVPPVKNWRDLVEHVGKNTSLGFYNVETADPTSRQIKLVTKFRLLEDKAAHVELFFGLEIMGIPSSGIDASLKVVGTSSDKTGFSFAIDRQPLSRTEVYGKRVKVPSGYEGNVILEVFNVSGQVFGDYSSISLVVYAVDSAREVLIGAEHLVFDTNPRVKKLALSYAANPPGPFYFRTSISDNGIFPRSGNPAYAPDIQPLGQVQDPNPALTLGNFSVDVTTKRKINLFIDGSNYIYLRGTTVRASSGQTRLFYLPAGVNLHPSLYTQPSHVVFDADDNGNPVTAFRRYKTAAAQQVVLTTPFTLDNIPQPGHYCMISECLPDGQTQWPHEKVSNFGTAAEFVAWILSEPCVCWRNAEVVSNPDPDTQTLQSSFTVPPGYSATDIFQFQVQATDCPIGSSFSVTSDDPAIRFPKTPITTNPTIASSQFTGKSPGYSVQVTIHWFANGQAVQSGQTLNAVLIQIVPQTAILAQVASASQVDENKAINTKGLLTTHVGKSYPNLVDPNATKDGRLKIGGAIRARSLGEDTDDYEWVDDPLIPIFKGIVVGGDRIVF